MGLPWVGLVILLVIPPAITPQVWNALNRRSRRCEQPEPAGTAPAGRRLFDSSSEGRRTGERPIRHSLERQAVFVVSDRIVEGRFGGEAPVRWGSWSERSWTASLSR
jgi:hypothetical protein